MTCTPLFSSLQCEGHLVQTAAFVAEGPEPQEGGGLGQVQTFVV